MKKLLLFSLILGACTNVPKSSKEWADASKAYYTASDFNLPQGTIKGWYPDDDVIKAQKAANTLDTIYIKIIEPNGHIVVTPCSFRAWATLFTGDKLR